MTKSQIAAQRRVYNIAAISAVGALLVWLSFSTGAEVRTGASRDAEVRAGAPSSTGELSLAAAEVDLEKAFWLCDHAATNGALDSGAAIACSTATEELKNSKFNGDFDALVAWWRENKPAEHQAIELARLASAFGN